MRKSYSQMNTSSSRTLTQFTLHSSTSYTLVVRRDNVKLFLKRLPDAKLFRMWNQGIRYRSPGHNIGTLKIQFIRESLVFV
jgi:hypothetical protein